MNLLIHFSSDNVIPEIRGDGGVITVSYIMS